MNYFECAEQLHKKHCVFDAHLDLGAIIHERTLKKQANILKEHYYENFKRGGLNLVVAAIFLEDVFLPELALRVALDQIALLKKEIALNAEWCMLVTSKREMQQALNEDKLGIILSLEGAEPIGSDIHLLDIFYDVGLRAMGLTWSRRNQVAEGSYFGKIRQGKPSGLSPFGIDVVERCEALGILIDLSHINDAGFEDTFKYTQKTLIVSHANTRKYNPITRNLTDQQIIQIANRGGVIGVNAYKTIVSPKMEKQTIGTMCDHIEYIVKLTGYQTIGIGFDLCGGFSDADACDCLKSHAETTLVTAELLKRGHKEQDLIGFLGGNFMRVFKKILP